MSALIASWKESGSYEEGIELIAVYAPNHAMLPVLRQEVSPINWLYLCQAIATLEVKAKEPKRVKAEIPDSGEAADLYARLKQLYHLKAKRHNDFFDVGTDLARARISDDLAKYRKEIHQISRKIEHFEKTGELVTIPSTTEVEYDLPDDPFRLSQMRRNILSNLSKCKNSLYRAFSQKNKKSIEKYEKKKVTLEHKLSATERKIEHIRKEKTG